MGDRDTLSMRFSSRDTLRNYCITEM